MRIILLSFCLLLNVASFANVETLIIDTGPGHASVTRFSNGDIMVYDTGHWSHQRTVMDKFTAFIGNADIDLLVISHSDADHLATTDELINNFQVNRVIRPGKVRNTNSWRSHNAAVVSAGQSGLTHDINLAEVDLPFGSIFRFGDARVTYLSGFHEPPAEWDLDHSEFLNAGSVVMRVEYKGHSILFTGDAVGRGEGSASDTPAIATERLLIDNAAARPIQSDVLIVPHHGSDDASSIEFIKAVAPRWVIFPAGKAHGHPKMVTAKRYMDSGLSNDCMLRTDLGDDFGSSDSWSVGGISGHNEKSGDDHIFITLQNSGDPIVRYEGKQPVNCAAVITASTPPVATTAVVKKSNSGICHAPSSRWYTRTKNFTPFNNLESCIDSGGRLPN